MHFYRYKHAYRTSLTLSDHTIAVVGTDAIARHTWASENATDGKTSSTKIGLLQVWQKQGGTWKLLARQSVRPPSDMTARSGIDDAPQRREAVRCVTGWTAISTTSSSTA